jgi:DNA-3-methyladenine glycosylase I
MTSSRAKPLFRRSEGSRAGRLHGARQIPRPAGESTGLRDDIPPKGRVATESRKKRCGWANNELAIRYHDEEWGVPVHDDRTLFEFLILEGAQAGLSWNTILNKRENYRKAFDGFHPGRVARYDRRKMQQLMGDPGIVRNKLKIASAVENAAAFLRVQKEFASFDRYIWQFVDGKPRVNHRKSLIQVPARTAQSDAMSRNLKRRGFRFVGSTICYAFMQAVGMVNDHMVDCFRYKALSGRSR